MKRKLIGVAPMLLLTVLALALGGCGSDGKQASTTTELTVSAASSLKTAFGQYAKNFPDATVRASFAGSDELAAQIEQGVRPDVFASANTKLPDRLFAKGLVEKPVVFAGNRLVIAVPASGAKVRSLGDLAKPGVKIAAGSPSVPVGGYTGTVLGRLDAKQTAAIQANIRSREPDVKGIIGKLTQGAVDAGFVYVTDVKAAGGKLRAIELPAKLDPHVAYGIAVVSGAKHSAAARKFIDGLLGGAGRDALDRAGFERPPR